MVLFLLLTGVEKWITSLVLVVEILLARPCEKIGQEAGKSSPVGLESPA
ncbi:MAG: hypothetical protein AAB359_00435 [Elusimicrobiota bacterium]